MYLTNDWSVFRPKIVFGIPEYENMNMKIHDMQKWMQSMYLTSEIEFCLVVFFIPDFNLYTVDALKNCTSIFFFGL